MPIAARTKVVIEEPCLRTPSITFSYKGPNPQDIYKKIKKLLPVIFKVDEHDIEEREFMWDRSTPQEKFRMVLVFIKEFDSNNYMEVEITLDGMTKPSREFGKEGEASIEIGAKLRAEYPQETFIERLFYSIFKRIYGHPEEKREKYKHMCSELVNTFSDELRSFLNILATG